MCKPMRVALAVVALFLAPLTAAPSNRPVIPSPASKSVVAPLPVIVNAGFEEGAGSAAPMPAGWSFGASGPGTTTTWETGFVHGGARSVRIWAAYQGGGYFKQCVSLSPNTQYVLSGWIKAERIYHKSGRWDLGAHLFADADVPANASVFGSTDWTFARVVFASGASGNVCVGGALGYSTYASPGEAETDGMAWFDDLRITPFDASAPHPSWKILALIYRTTDFTPPGDNRLVGSIPASQVSAAAWAVSYFVQRDIPLLTNGNMTPSLTIRYVNVLSRLTPDAGGWWPTPIDTVADRDPAFDSVIVIWQPTVIDQATGATRWIGSAAGLTPDMENGQAYAAIIIEAATTYGHLNVFKHEWGHSILSYFNSTGRSPKPTVTNHATAGQYVHCGSGAAYTWIDESFANRVPNSIYNDFSGFTHDYYSGTTALASDPATCLGIPPLAWAMGGPVTLPSLAAAHSDAEVLDALRRVVWAAIELAPKLTAAQRWWLGQWYDELRKAVAASDRDRVADLARLLQSQLVKGVSERWLNPADVGALQATLEQVLAII